MCETILTGNIGQFISGSMASIIIASIDPVLGHLDKYFLPQVMIHEYGITEYLISFSK